MRRFLMRAAGLTVAAILSLTQPAGARRPRIRPAYVAGAPR